MDISESVRAILTHNASVSSLFYEKYLARAPEIGRFFADTDMAHQAVVLRMALGLVGQYYHHRSGAIEDYLRLIGLRHKRQQIPCELFSGWRDCMIATLEEFHGDNWSEDFKEQWSTALDLTIECMLSGYDLRHGSY